MTTSPWFQLALVLIPIVLPPLITLCAVLYNHWIQSLPQQKRALAEQVVRTVVPAVEQTADDTMSNPAKKKAAMDLAEQMLKSLHITVSEDMLSALIEATVFALNQAKQAQTVVTQPSPLAEAKSS